MKWVDLTTAPDQLTAEMWRDVLVDQGIRARLRPGDTTSFLGVSPFPTGLMVDEDQLERAQEVLETSLGES